MKNKDWKKKFLKIHYEPEHKTGQTCWCIPRIITSNKRIKIIHNEQRVVLVSFIESILKSKQEEIEKVIDNKKVNENLRDMICKSRSEHNKQLDDLKPIISNILK